VGCCIPSYQGELVRTFICIEIPQEHIEKLSYWIKQHKSLTDEVRWVKAETIHLTLKFCGERPQELVVELIEKLERYKPQGALQLSLGGIGGFPNLEKPRVIWTAVGGEIDRLVKLAMQFEKIASSCGMERSNKAFTPHVTLGRRTAFGGLPAFVTEKFLSEAINLPAWTADEFVLMQSRLLPTGAEYTQLARYKI